MNKKNEKVKEVYDKLVNGVEGFRNTDEYIKFLKFAKNFHNYSFSNKVLIFSQFEDATQVMGYKKWQSVGRYVKPESKGIQIFCPMMLKRKVKVKDENENETEEEQSYLRFRPGYVYDISQTEGQEVPKLPSVLDSNTKENLLEKLITFSPLPVNYKKLSKNHYGYYDVKNKYIVLNETMSIDDKVSTLLHELTHALYDDFNYQENKNLSEVFVESVSFIVADYFDLDTSLCSFKYVNDYANNDAKVVIDLGTKIQETAKNFIEKLEFEFSKKLEVAV